MARIGNTRAVVLYNDEGKEYLCHSIADAAKTLNENYSKVFQRLRDGHRLYIKKGTYVRIRYAET